MFKLSKRLFFKPSVEPSAQQQAMLNTFVQAMHGNAKVQNNAWQCLKHWVQKRLYPWTHRYQSIAEDLVQEALITLWLALQHQPCKGNGCNNNNQLQRQVVGSSAHPTTVSDAVLYYWHIVNKLEQQTRNLSKKELRYWHRHAPVAVPDNTKESGGYATMSTEMQWEAQVYAQAQRHPARNSGLEQISVEIADINQCLSVLLKALQRQAVWGEKAHWFLKTRFQLTETLNPNVVAPVATAVEHKGYQQKQIAQQLGISQQAVSGYEKRLLQYCQQVLQAYYPF
jgi:hypothetical protein